MDRRLLAICLLIAITLTAAFAIAGMAPPPHEPLPISDEEPPGEAVFPEPVVLEVQRIKRADRRQEHSKSDLGILMLQIHGYEPEYAGAEPDGDPWSFDLEDAIYGLRFDVEGVAPEGVLINLPAEPVVLIHPFDTLQIVWGDRQTRRDDIELTITATWVDRYGRTGPTSDPLVVVDGGGSGCSSTGGGPAPAPLLVVMMGLLGLRRSPPR